MNAFERLVRTGSGSDRVSASTRTHPQAMVPARKKNPVATAPDSDYGTILTGEMFAPILSDQIGRYNELFKTRLEVLAVPNTYFGGDVSVAGLLTGKDYLAIADQVKGDFVIIPKHTIKSDEPILLDGMMFDELKSKFPVPIYDLDTNGLIKFLSR
jgi:NifB/MoaA-like Fe-S oxidoreductase